MKTKLILFLIFLGAQVSAAPNLEPSQLDFPIEINFEEEIKSCPGRGTKHLAPSWVRGLLQAASRLGEEGGP